MYTCPACGAINYNVGPCQCCGYGKGVSINTIETLPPGFVEALKKKHK